MLWMVCYTFLGPSRRVLHLQTARKDSQYTRNVKLKHKQNVNTTHKDKTSTRNVQAKRQHETYKQKVNSKRQALNSVNQLAPASQLGQSTRFVRRYGQVT